MAFVRACVRASVLASSAVSIVAVAPAAAQSSPPFGVQDLVRLQRISEPAASPDGRRVACTRRTTDMDANRGRTGVWLVDTRDSRRAAVRITDIAANADSAQWSADSRFVYYLSNRSGSSQMWRSDSSGHDSMQITNLPLDVGSFRVAPTLDRLLVSMEVFRDCADLACTQKRLDTMAHAPARGIPGSTPIGCARSAGRTAVT